MTFLVILGEIDPDVVDFRTRCTRSKVGISLLEAAVTTRTVIYPVL